MNIEAEKAKFKNSKHLYTHYSNTPVLQNSKCETKGSGVSWNRS